MLHVVLTGENDGYYACYPPSLEALAQTINRGWYYEGQPWPLTGKPRGSAMDGLAASQLVYALQNHDPYLTHELPDPQAVSTFEQSKLNWLERGATRHARSLELYRKMLSFRKNDEVLAKRPSEHLLADVVDGLLRVKRWHGGNSRTLLVNLSDRGREVPVEMRTGRVLLASSTVITNGLEVPPWSAVVLGESRGTTG